MWLRTSSAISSSMPERRKNLAATERKYHSTSRLPGLRGQRRRDRGGQPVPILCFTLEPFASGRGQLVVFRAPVVLRRAPLRLQQPLSHQPEQRGIERPLLDQQRLIRYLPDPQQHSIPVQRAQRHGFENEQVERSGK